MSSSGMSAKPIHIFRMSQAELESFCEKLVDYVIPLGSHLSSKIDHALLQTISR